MRYINVIDNYSLGGSTVCCQGTNPVTTQDAYCGWWLNIDLADTAPASPEAGNVPICGKPVEALH